MITIFSVKIYLLLVKIVVPPLASKYIEREREREKLYVEAMTEIMVIMVNNWVNIMSYQ